MQTIRALLFLAILFQAVAVAAAQSPALKVEILQNIREDHPRVFVSRDNIDAVKAGALGRDRQLYNKIKAELDALAGQKIEFKDLNIADGTQSQDHAHGFHAANAALVWLVEQDPARLALAKSLLRELGVYYNHRNRAGRNIHWFAFSRICALAAFDWIYPALTPRERTELGRPLLEAIGVMALRDGRKPFLRENTGDHSHEMKVCMFTPSRLANAFCARPLVR